MFSFCQNPGQISISDYHISITIAYPSSLSIAIALLVQKSNASGLSSEASWEASLTLALVL